MTHLTSAHKSSTTLNITHEEETKEFSHIQVRVVRNPAWLKQKHPFFLSEEFPIADFELPRKFVNMTEDDLINLRIWVKAHLTRFLRIKQEASSQ